MDNKFSMTCRYNNVELQVEESYGIGTVKVSYNNYCMETFKFVFGVGLFSKILGCLKAEKQNE